jgi:hypothetical protein
MNTLYVIEHQPHCVREVLRLSAQGYGPMGDNEA